MDYKPYKIPVNNNFIGRDFEIQKLTEISKSGESSIIILYGRRRIGKTELLEQTFRKRNVIKLEGIEGREQSFQIQSVLLQLSKYLNNPIIAKLNIKTWTEIFELIAEHFNKGTWTIYFEELQWLASYDDKFITELKYVWDNYFRHNKNLIIILCGSSPSFMLNHVVHSKALYNRSQHEIHLKEFSFEEINSFLGKKRSKNEIMDAYLSIGGVPEYLKYINSDSSIFLGLCNNSFVSNAFFAGEYSKIFTSSLASNKNYKKIVEFLSKYRFAARNEISAYLKVESGGTLTNLLTDLEICGFIEKYTPFNAGEDSLLARYQITDQYLQFYFKFIKPIQKRIDNGEYNKYPTKAISHDSYRKWLGHAFERMCRKKHQIIARILGFESVQYNYGAFFNRETQKNDPNYQIDLVFQRKDRVYSICEIKYLQKPVSKKIVHEFEGKLSNFPNRDKHTIQKVLIASSGASPDVTSSGYFDRIITLDDLLDERYL